MMTRGVPNYTRRSLYIAESGMRYANSELKNSGYTSAVISTLNTTTYSLNNDVGSFEFNVFGKWFESSSDFSFPGSGTITLNIPEGEIPDGFSIPQQAHVVNLESYRDSLVFAGTPIKFAGRIQSTPDMDVIPLSISLADNFQSDQNQAVCLAVQPSSAQSNLTAGSTLNVASEAGVFFPERHGSFYVSNILGDGNVLYYYEEMVSQSGYMELKNLQEQAVEDQAIPGLSSGFPFDVATSDYIILSPINHMIFSESTVGSGSSVGNKNLALDYQQNIYTPQPVPPPDPLDLPPDLPTDETVAATTVQNESDTNAIDVDVGSGTITLGGDVASEFGTVFFGGDKEIGGRTDVCVDGKCLFNYGIRIFFLLDYQGTGDGFTVALINGTDNDKTSVGGYRYYGESLGYAGDGQISFGNYISGTKHGLLSPKMALEFDTHTNGSLYDPLLSDRDTLQYVFWGDNVASLLDDNRHDTGGGEEGWAFDTHGDVRSSPVVKESDGTIYVGSNNNTLCAINPDGSEKWTFTTPNRDVLSSPAIGDDGTIYVGSDDNKLYAITDNTTYWTEKWAFPTLGDVRSRPAIDPFDGTIYVGSNDNKLYAIDPEDGAKKWEFDTGGNVESSPLVGPDGNIYVGSNDGRLYVIDREGIEITSFYLHGAVKSSPDLGPDGTIYVGSDDENLYAISPTCNPLNIKDKYYTYNYLPQAEKDRITDQNNWLDSVLNGNILWSVRMEVKRSKVANVYGNYEYTLRTWIRLCTEADCSDILGTYFQDTRIEYGAKDPHLEQTIELCPDDHNDFDKFLFGLTEATSPTNTQTVVISNLQLGFIRPGDFVIKDDEYWQ